MKVGLKGRTLCYKPFTGGTAVNKTKYPLVFLWCRGGAAMGTENKQLNEANIDRML